MHTVFDSSVNEGVQIISCIERDLCLEGVKKMIIINDCTLYLLLACYLLGQGSYFDDCKSVF